MKAKLGTQFATQNKDSYWKEVDPQNLLSKQEKETLWSYISYQLLATPYNGAIYSKSYFDLIAKDILNLIQQDRRDIAASIMDRMHEHYILKI